MKQATSWKPFKDVSIAKKLYLIVGAMAVLIIIELLTLWFAIHTLSSVRSFIAAESLWSKAQKNAVYQLGKYQRTHNEQDYRDFMKFMSVPLGDHNARVELFKENADLDIVRKGFLQGRIHPDDIDGMIKLVQRFNKVYYINKALGYWGQGDSLISVLIPKADAMRNEILSGSASQEKMDHFAIEIDTIDKQLTDLEDNFSFTLEEGSRWLENLILKILFSVALTVEITGLVLTVLVTRRITKGLNEINKVADKITKGQLDERVTVFSNDEIGRVANSVNRMTEQLIVSNQELEQFAYIASHDLQEPLRKIVMFTDLLEQETSKTASDKGKMYMQRITDSASRMQRLIRDVLQFAGVSSTTEFVPVDLNRIIDGIISELEITISKANATITVGDIPEVEANVTQMEQLFQNLISNALKFSNSDPLIEITATLIEKNDLKKDTSPEMLTKIFDSNNSNEIPEKFCRIYIKDNGIGFDEIYADKIFYAFQRLHGKHVYEGTGIGLAICHKIVENHHGIIGAHSSPGKGATFIITLPLIQHTD